MSKYERIEDVYLKKANKHHGDIDKDMMFDCENNCPYCNDEKICVKPTDAHIVDYCFDSLFGILRTMKCYLCGNEFWEVWDIGEIDEDEDIYYEMIFDASYEYTVLEFPLDEDLFPLPEQAYPTYRRLTPEIVDIFASGPIESRFEFWICKLKYVVIFFSQIFKKHAP